MPYRTVHVCPKCGVRNESPDMTVFDLIDQAKMFDQVIAISEMMGGKSGEATKDHPCADCQEIDLPGNREGVDRAYEQHVRPEGR